MPNRRELSPLAWAMLDQLRQQGRVWDGDCVSKAGRDELIACGLAMRDVLRARRRSLEPGDLRSAYNAACDRLDVLASKLIER